MRCRAIEMSDTSHVHDLRAGGCELPIPTWQGPFAYSRPAASWAGSYRLLIVTVDLTYGQYSCWSTLRVEHPSSRLFCFFLWVLTCFLLSDQHTHTNIQFLLISIILSSSWVSLDHKIASMCRLLTSLTIWACMCVPVHVLYDCACMLVCLCVVCVHGCKCVFMCVCTCVFVCVHACTCVFAQMHVCAHVHMCMCSYTNTCICLCMPMPISSIFLFCTHIMHLFISLSLNTLTTRKSNSWHFLYPFHLGLLSCGNCHSWEPHAHRFWVLP